MPFCLYTCMYRKLSHFHLCLPSSDAGNNYIWRRKLRTLRDCYAVYGFPDFYRTLQSVSSGVQKVNKHLKHFSKSEILLSIIFLSLYFFFRWKLLFKKVSICHEWIHYAMILESTLETLQALLSCPSKWFFITYFSHMKPYQFLCFIV